MSTSDGTGVVIVADQIEELGGSERVLAAILELYPGARVFAPAFSTTNLPPGQTHPWNGHVSHLGRHGPRRHFLAPLYARRLAGETIGSANVVLSLAHAGWSIAVRIPPGARHLCYNAGPPRWLYGHTDRYLRTYPRALRPALRAAVPALRAHHRRLMRLPDRVVTNSTFSARQIESLFGRAAETIHPPVRTDFFTPAPRRRRHLLTVSRLVPHKRVDAVIEAFRGLPHQLVVVGGGPCLDQLRRDAPPNVTFTGYVDDRRLRELYRSSVALISPAVEEFGIVMAEAEATGTPVIAPRRGGALEIVRDASTGKLLDRIDPESIAQAVRDVARAPFDGDACRQSTHRFGQTRFLSELERVVDEELGLAAGPRVRASRRAAKASPAGVL